MRRATEPRPAPGQPRRLTKVPRVRRADSTTRTRQGVPRAHDQQRRHQLPRLGPPGHRVRHRRRGWRTSASSATSTRPAASSKAACRPPARHAPDLDEPTASLDVRAEARFFEEVRRAHPGRDDAADRGPGLAASSNPSVSYSCLRSPLVAADRDDLFRRLRCWSDEGRDVAAGSNEECVPGGGKAGGAQLGVVRMEDVPPVLAGWASAEAAVGG